ncbi:MAG: TolB family protein [Solirubrobacterales bacterium]
MPKRSIGILLLVVTFLAVGGMIAWTSGRTERVDRFVSVDRPARIFPNYSGAVIPPNIAPLNFEIRERGTAYAARISSNQGDPIEISGKSPAMLIPKGPWHDLLAQNRGGDLRIEVFVKDLTGQWIRPNVVTARIASEDIDRYLVYRRMHMGHMHVRSPIGIYCRDLTDFKESLVLSSSDCGKACVNCHSFPQGRTDRMLIGLRSPQYGVATLVVEGQSARRIDKKFGYTSWHPSGRLAAFSINDLPMFYHTSRNEARDTTDLDSLLAFYNSDTKSVFGVPQVERKDRLENWPAWSGDGRHLYFCSAPKLWTDDAKYPPAQYDQVRYDLMRIAYDPDTDKWGEPETVLSATTTGKSIAMPRCSPDGRWLSFCMCNYGYFPTWQEDSDIYLLDLHGSATPPLPYRPEFNSDRSESWQTWSSNSRWLVYSSKAQNGFFTRLFISYIDSEGKAHKPIVLPQKDPAFYESCLQNYNTAELVVEPPRIAAKRLAAAFRRSSDIALGLPTTGPTPIAKPTPQSTQNVPGRAQRD